MKYYLILSAALLLAACAKQEEELLISDFIKGSTHNGAYHKYQSINDSSSTIVYFSQQYQLINNSIAEFSTMWLNADSLPINAVVERYDEQNRVQMVKQSYFEQIGPESVVEIKGKLDSISFKSILNNAQTFDINFRPVVDSTVTLRIKADVVAKFIKEDTKEKEQLLEITSKESTQIDFTDARKDTILITSTRKVFSKTKGLIYFEVQSNNEKSLYKLVE